MFCKYKYIDKEARDFLFYGTLSYNNNSKDICNKNILNTLDIPFTSIVDVIICYMHENDGIDKLCFLLEKYKYIDFTQHKNITKHFKCLNYTLSDKQIILKLLQYNTSIDKKDIDENDVENIDTLKYEYNKYSKMFRNIFKVKFNGRLFTCYDAFKFTDRNPYPMFFIDFAIDYYNEMDYENLFYVLISGLRDSEALIYYKIYLSGIDIENVKGFVVTRCTEVFFTYKLENYHTNVNSLSQFLKDYKNLSASEVILKYNIPLYLSIQGYKKYL